MLQIAYKQPTTDSGLHGFAAIMSSRYTEHGWETKQKPFRLMRSDYPQITPFLFPVSENLRSSAMIWRLTTSPLMT